MRTSMAYFAGVGNRGCRGRGRARRRPPDGKHHEPALGLKDFEALDASIVATHAARDAAVMCGGEDIRR